MGGIISGQKKDESNEESTAYHSKPTSHAKTIDLTQSSQQKAATMATERKKIAEQVRRQRENREHRNVVVGENSDDMALHSNEKKITIPSYKKDKESTEIIMNALRTHFLFGSLRPKEMERVADAMKEEELSEGCAAITQGEKGVRANKFYVVKEGSFDIIVDGKKVSSETTGGCFGELALMYNAPRAATCMATTDAIVFTLDRILFKMLLIEASNKQAAKRMQFLSEVPLLKSMNKAELERLGDSFSVMQYEDKTTIIKQGDEGDTFYIIEEGEVTIHKDGKLEPISTLGVGAYFGEQALLKKEVRGASVCAKGLVRCLVLSKGDFEIIFGKMSDLMNRVHDQRLKEEEEKRGADAVDDENPYDLDMTIKASDLDICGVIGQGAFGLVSLVKTNGQNAKPLALKQLSKKQLVMTKQMSNVVREKEVMQMLIHPHILKLTGTFSDDNSLYFVLEYLQGGDVFGRLCKTGGRFDMRTSRVYAACVTDTFAYMHGKNILYRDLKPENLVLDKDGILKVVDFGMAKKTTMRTFTVCGTPEYMAPEIINGRGHHKAVDYWALGVLIYEMLTGATPFGGDGSNHLMIYKRVNSSKKIDFPKALDRPGDGRNAIKIIKQLLQKRATRRLGCLQAGCDGVKDMPWFKTIDWQKIRSGTCTMPIKPKCKDAFDMSNFDDWGEDHKVATYKSRGMMFEKTWEKHFPHCGMKRFGSY